MSHIRFLSMLRCPVLKHSNKAQPKSSWIYNLDIFDILGGEIHWPFRCDMRQRPTLSPPASSPPLRSLNPSSPAHLGESVLILHSKMISIKLLSWKYNRKNPAWNIICPSKQNQLCLAKKTTGRIINEQHKEQHILLKNNNEAPLKKAQDILR
jgi:hypothetical protein